TELQLSQRRSELHLLLPALLVICDYHVQDGQLFFCFICSADRQVLLSFPTRRSSDLPTPRAAALHRTPGAEPLALGPPREARRQDRKSTRLNSSHGSTSYAVFCLKKKNSEARSLSPLSVRLTARSGEVAAVASRERRV